MFCLATKLERENAEMFLLTLSWVPGEEWGEAEQPGEPLTATHCQRPGQRGQARALPPEKHRDLEGHTRGQSQDAQHSWTQGLRVSETRVYTHRHVHPATTFPFNAAASASCPKAEK